jgi:hypothetical protein
LLPLPEWVVGFLQSATRLPMGTRELMGLFGKTKQPSAPPPTPPAASSMPAIGLGAGSLTYQAGYGGGLRPGRWTGPTASNSTGPDVFRYINEDWGRRQTLLGYADRLRCEQADASGWEFHRGASFSADATRRLNEDDTTLQIVALFGPFSPVRWDDLRRSYPDAMHLDFDQLADARFTATDPTGAPICVFRVRTLAVRVRMTGTLSNRQYTRVYALDVCQHLDIPALGLWMNATANMI